MSVYVNTTHAVWCQLTFRQDFQACSVLFKWCGCLLLDQLSLQALTKKVWFADATPPTLTRCCQPLGHPQRTYSSDKSSGCFEREELVAGQASKTSAVPGGCKGSPTTSQPQIDMIRHESKFSWVNTNVVSICSGPSVLFRVCQWGRAVQNIRLRAAVVGC